MRAPAGFKNLGMPYVYSSRTFTRSSTGAIAWSVAPASRYVPSQWPNVRSLAPSVAQPTVSGPPPSADCDGGANHLHARSSPGVPVPNSMPASCSAWSTWMPGK